MNRYNKLLLFLVIAFSITKATAQETLPNTTFQMVKTIEATSKLSGLKMFELKDGNSLFVQYSTGVFLFDPSGKVVKQTTNILEAKDHTRLTSFEMGDKIVMLTQSNEGNELVAHLWDIGSADKAVKLSEVRFIKPKLNMILSYEFSPDGKKLLLAGPCKEKLVVLNSELKVEVEKELIKTAKTGTETESILDGMAIDNDGNIALSIFFKEESTLFKRPSGSWAVIGVPNKGNGFKAWDVAKVFSIDQYASNVSRTASIGNGKFAFSFCNSVKNPGQLMLAVLDVVDENIVASHTIEVGEPVTNTKRTIPSSIITMEAVNENALAITYSQNSPVSASSVGQRGGALINIREGKLISSGDMFPPADSYSPMKLEALTISNGSLSMFTGYASPEIFEYVKLKKPVHSKAYSSNLNTKKFLPYLVIHDASDDTVDHYTCYDNPKVKYENKRLFFSNKGTLVVAEMDDKGITLHVHK